MHGRHAVMEQIESREVHLWLALLDEITDPRLISEYRLLLSTEELQQQQRFQFERDRHRFLVTRAMVRTVLSKYANVAPYDWQFVVNAYGRPSISADQVNGRRIEFNVSHTSRVVLLGLALERAVGVDVEEIAGDQAGTDIADRFFALEEVRALHALPLEQQAQRFFEYWTLKESYIKARGAGLSIPLDRFAFNLDDAPRIRLAIDPLLADRSDRWAFWQLRPARDHLAAVCAEQSTSGCLELSALRQWPGIAGAAGEG